MRKRRGLTLIEVIVSLTIGSLVIAAVLGVLSTARRTQTAGEQRSELFQSVRVTLSQMERDLSAAVQREDDWQFEFITTDEVVNGLPMDTMEFASASGQPLGSILPTGDLVRVQYYIDTDEGTPETGLMRTALSLPLLEEISPEQIELSGRSYCPWTVGLDLQYHDSDEQTWIDNWEERVDLPPAVRIVLYPVLLDANEEIEEADIDGVIPFSTVVYLRLAATPLGTGHVGAADDQAGAGQPGMGPDDEQPGPDEEPGPGEPGGALPGGMGGIPGMPTPGAGGTGFGGGTP